MLLGRNSELLAVDQALDAARQGRGSCLVIRGEPGMGKTALLDYAISRATSMRFLKARGVEFEADVPFAGLHDLLHPALGFLDRLSPRHAAALRSSFGLGPRIESDRLIVGVAVLGLISAYAEEAPLLITVDDVQWLDRASTDAIGFAARRLSADPVAILIAAREGEESAILAAGSQSLPLRGLDLPSATALLGTVASGAISAIVARQLLEATGGNPLALLELGAEITHTALSQFNALPIETSVERAYLRRAEGLPGGARQVLLLMAASGSSDLALIRRAATELGLGTSEIEQAEASRPLVRDQPGILEFVHPLARAAIYHAASPAERRAAHQALANAMRDQPEMDRRAWHLAAAARGWDSTAATLLDNAARRARESGGYAAAASAWRESARLTESPELRAERLYSSAENAWLGGQTDEAIDSLDTAVRLAPTLNLCVEIDSLKGHIALVRGNVPEGYELLIRAADAIEVVDRLKAIRILGDATVSSNGVAQSADTQAIAQKCLELLRPHDPPESAVFAHVAFGTSAIMAGHGAEGAEHLQQAVKCFEQIPEGNADPVLLRCAAMTGLFLRDAKAGRDLLDRALRLAREQAPSFLASLLFFLGRDAAATDRWALARAQYEESARIAQETTQIRWLAGSLAGLAWLDALEGNDRECRSRAARAMALSNQHGQNSFKAWSLIALGLLELGLGQTESALQNLSACAEFLRQVGYNDPDISPAPDIVDVLVRMGRTEEALAVADGFEPAARAKGLPFALGRAERALGLVAKDDSYVAHFETALRYHDATLDAFERARTQLNFGERLRRNRRRLDARKYLRLALKTFDELGAAPWSARAVKELEASGETARVGNDRRSERLTPQELQVALTLAEGLTRREAAARLYLSPKTVEYHLRHIYEKLDIRTREDLKAAMSPAT